MPEAEIEKIKEVWHEEDIKTVLSLRKRREAGLCML